MSAHDQWLAAYRSGPAQVWCPNPFCDNHDEPTEVTYVSEYGQGWYEPEECCCGHAWSEDAPVRVGPWDPELSDAENLGSS